MSHATCHSTALNTSLVDSFWLGISSCIFACYAKHNVLTISY